MDEHPMAERILDTAEEVLRRHGVDKTNVVDIARALGMSHGNIYRHYPSKQALIDAVALRWLHAVLRPLEAIARNAGLSAAERLSQWFDTLREMKRRKVLDDPELFRVHHQIVGQAPQIVDEHVAAMRAQVTRIISDGIAAGEFSQGLDATKSAWAFLQATSPFHHPALILQAGGVSDTDARAVFALLLAGLKAG